MKTYGAPEIFNTDQGAQFTCTEFTGLLNRHGVTISMDGRGRALDNIFVERLWRTVKYEEVYLKQHATLQGLSDGLMNYFAFYNTKRPHQSLGYKTPDEVYRLAEGGGAKIVDKYKASTTRQMPDENRGVEPLSRSVMRVLS